MTLRAMDWINDAQKRQAASEQAENNWYAKQLGQEPDQVDSEMGNTNTILGDILQPPAVVIAPPAPKTSIWPIAAMALAAMVPVAGIGAAGAGAAAAYLLSRPAPQPVVPPSNPEFEDSSVSIGLGRLEDFQP